MTLSSASNLLHGIPENSWGELVAIYYSFWHPWDPVCSAAEVAGAFWVDVNLFKANPKPTGRVSTAPHPCQSRTQQVYQLMLAATLTITWVLVSLEPDQNKNC